MALNNRITLRRQHATRDSAGQPLTAWVDVAVLWADVKVETGTAAIRGDRPLSTVRASVKIRARQDIAPGMQVQYGDLSFNVEAVLPDARDRHFVFLVCEAAR